MKKNPNGMMPDKKICESCNEDFSCGANAAKCWCFEIKLSEDTLKLLRENCKNCLCLNCLESLYKRQNHV